MKRLSWILGCLASAQIAGAVLLVEESFTNDVGMQMGNLTGGTGWGTNKWVSNYATNLIANTSLAYPGVVTNGNNASLFECRSTPPTTSRLFGSPVSDSTAGTYWMAMLLQSSAMKAVYTFQCTTNGGAFTLLTMTGNTGTPPVYKFLGTNTVMNATNIPVLILIRIVMDPAGLDNMTCFANPDLGNPGSWGGGVSTNLDLSGTIKGIATRGNNNSSSYFINFDEFRIATTWQEAVGQLPAGVWDGGNASGNWSEGGAGGNWSGVAAPVNGLDMDLMFMTNKNGQVSSNDLASPFVVNSLTFSNDITLSGGALKFSGVSRSVGVASGRTAVINNPLVLSNTQTYFQGAGTGVIAGVVQDATSGNGLTKTGSGVWILATANTYSGWTRINNGTLVLGPAGSVNNSSVVQVSAGATLNVSSSGFNLGSGQTLSGQGTVIGSLTGSSGSFVTPGVGGVGVVTNNLASGAVATFNAGATFSFELGAPGVSDALAFTGLSSGVTNVAFNNNMINLSDGGGLAVGTYTLFTFDQNNTYRGTLVMGSVPTGYSAELIYNAGNIQVKLTADALATVSIVKVADGAEDASVNGAFAVSRLADAGTSTAVTVYYTVTGSAVSNSDYVALSGSTLIPSGQLSVTNPVTVIQDLDFNEGNETVILNLIPSAGYTIGAPNSATVNIADGAKSVINVVKTADGSEEGPANGTLSFWRPAGLATGVSVTVYFTVDPSSSATAGSDYTTLSSNITLGAGVTNISLSVVVLKDTNFAEGTEFLTVGLTPDAAYTVGDASNATVNIADAIQPVVSLVKTADASEYGSINGSFLISRQVASTGSAVMVYLAVDGASSAQAGSDYTMLATNVMLTNGVDSVVIPVFVQRDGLYNEGTETLKMDLVPNGFYALSAASNAIMSIADDVVPVLGAKGGFAALYTFSNTVPGSVVDPTPAPYEPGVIFSPFSMVAAIGVNAQVGRFYADNWPANVTLNPAHYMQVTVTPVPGARVTITNITFDVARMNSGGLGPVRYALRSSRDGYTTNLSTFTISPANGNLSVTNADTLVIGGADTGSGVWQTGANLTLGEQFIDLTNGVTLRVYGWGNGATKDGGIDNFSIQGLWTVPGKPGTLILFN